MYPNLRWLKALPLVALVALALIVAGCAPSPTVAPGGTPAPPQPTTPPGVTLPEGMGVDTLRVAIGTEPPTLDQAIATDTTSHSIINQLFTGLYDYRPDGSIVPAGALSYEVSEDGTVYTIHLDPNAKWSDGQTVLAQHYVDGICRLLTPATASEYAYVMYYIVGAAEFNGGETADCSGVGLRAVDDFTFEITLAAPQAFFDSILAFFTTYPTRLDVIEQYGEDWVLPGNLVGNGPYILTEHEPQDHVTLEVNPNWWKEEPAIKRIIYPVIVEDATSLAAYENNELDSTGDAGYPSGELPRILGDPVLSQQFHILPRPGVYYVGFNTLRPPTDNVHMRIALASAIDRRSILDNVLNLPWREAALGVIAPGIPGYQGTDTGWPFNPEAARTHLAAYIADEGLTCTADAPCGFLVDLWFNRGNEDVIEGVAAGWSENLVLTDDAGNEIARVRVSLVNMEWAVYLDTLDQCNTTPDDVALCDYNAYRLGWVMDYGDANNIVNEVFAPGSPFQYTGYESAEVSDLINQALGERDAAGRAALWQSAEDLIVTDLVITAPIFYYDRTGMLKPWLDFEFPPFGAAYFKNWGFVEGA